MGVRVIGLRELQDDLVEMARRVEDLDIVYRQLASLMVDYVHVKSGFLKSSIGYNSQGAFASAPYASIEDERGGSHAFSIRAIDSFKEDEYLDRIVEPF